MLSKRLAAIASMVKKDTIVADIGSDHGLLPCFLAKNNIVKKAYAIDNKEGPLSFAKENIEKYCLEDKVFAVLGDGLNKIKDDTNSLVIAGMGFLTIKYILEEDINKVVKMKNIVVQANKNIVGLRKWIIDHNFYIDEEKIVEEKGHYYIIISFNPQKDNNRDNYFVSEDLLKKDDSLYKEYLDYRLKKLKEINLYKNSSSISKEIKYIETALKRSEK